MQQSSSAFLKQDLLLRSLAFTVVYVTVIFVLNNFLNFWALWPGAVNTLAGKSSASLGWLQVLSYAVAPLLAAVHVSRLRRQSYQMLADRVSNWAATTIKAAFWMVLLVGMVDMLVSLLRIESLLVPLVGETIAVELGKPQFRGTYVHLPLMLLACFIALRSKGLGFVWLTLLVVVAEFLIVIARFVFSYEQAFMGDLVRFWYAALFLFASAHTLLIEGHIRVDVAYTHFKQRTQSWVNVLGVCLLGLPLCFTILTLGMWDKTSSINSPLLSVEVSQSGYGMYVKYIMVGFLAIFAFSMIIQFSSYLLKHFGVLRGEAMPTTANT
ncbi:MAG: TRAP transporter small permease subunit [Gammaproteobacteria bacterium]|nr:TRAP transporter small permease subunit [Gammaproteobacteria bacterium]